MKLNSTSSISSVSVIAFAAVIMLTGNVRSQVNSGSNGSDGAFNPTTNTVINMADHPNGIYQYTSVNIPGGVTVTFVPNLANTPVVWLVQSNVVINGVINISGSPSLNGSGGLGGPGAFRGGNGGSNPGRGEGPGGGSPGTNNTGQNGTYNYGNVFIIPLVGGSGGGGATGAAGGGGGGAILITASGELRLDGQVFSDSGFPQMGYWYGGFGSGGAIRLVASKVTGSGSIRVWNSYSGLPTGRIRIDTLDYNFGGQINGPFTQGFQPIIIPTSGQGVQLSIASVAGVSVSAMPNGQIASPDAVISGQQANPIPVVVNCANLPLNTLITVTVKPASGASVNAVGYNTTGTLASSTATVSLNMPRGGGIIYATAATSN